MEKHQTHDDDKIVINVASEISQIDSASWDACANPYPGSANPFVSHAFLSALEDSASTGLDAGWIPRHLSLRDQDGTICGVMPCYIKTHSQGEYVFDFSWAQAMERAGQSYYPKLQCAVPFTPVPGPRILIKPGPDATHHERVLATAAVELTKQMELSSLHITFVDERQQGHLAKLGFLQRTDQQFHWHNDNYTSFDDFLDALSSRKRKTVRKERSQATQDGISIEHLHADAITPAHWDTFYKFYLDTGDRKWGTPYLNRDFFMRLGDTMSEHCLLIMAKRDGRYIAGALHIIGGDCLYGRYWGASEHVPCLHFELCYYQAIEYAIKHRLARVEAGAQGEHKLARGYKPTTTYSAHWIADPGLSDAVARYLAKERARVKHMHTVLEDFTPFKKTNAPSKDH